MIWLSAYLILMAALNRARGSRLFNLTTSTTIGRLSSTGGMAIATALLADNPIIIPILWTGLFLWTLPAWDKYWSAAIGNPTDMAATSFAPVDWIMAKLWPSPKPGIQLRLWGTIAMGLRGALLFPLFAILGFMRYPAAFLIGLATLLQGVPYLISGIPSDKSYSIPFAETLWGACLGLMFMMALHAALH
jgi:hypothetical protein